MFFTVLQRAASGLQLEYPGKGTDIHITHCLAYHLHRQVRINKKILGLFNALFRDVFAYRYAGHFLEDIIQLGFAD